MKMKLHRDWKSPMARLERFARDHVGELASETALEFMDRFTGPTIGGFMALGRMDYDPATRSAILYIAVDGLPDGSGTVVIGGGTAG
jgi:hypothetical protein